MALKIQLRRGTAAEWTSANPVLMQGEMGVETDTLKVKLGNGTTAWNSLTYFTQGAKGDTGATGPTGPTGLTGATGPTGPAGPANTLTVGTVTTGAAGSSATVTITGDSPNQTISFQIPQGVQGIQGIQGPQGVGVPTGGTEGQIIVKTVDGTAWVDNVVPQVKYTVRNTTGSTIPKGSVVYISGSNGTNILISLADADTEATSSKTIGIVETDIANNAFGYVVTEGLLAGLNTSGATAGQSVWLSSTSGAFVFGAPPAKPAHSVYLGVVSRVNANNGEIFVKVQNGYELDELHDVQIVSPQDKQVLAYEGGLWKNKVASGGVTVSATAPASPIAGDAWFDSNDGLLYVYYSDADSSQWVEVKANSALNADIMSRLATVETRANVLPISPNYIINGGFDIWQRGTSISMASNVSQYTADRWLCNSTFSAGTSSVSQQTFTPGAAPVAGYEGTYFLRMTAGSTASWMEFVQRIEDVRTGAGQTVTVSFWAKASVATTFTTLLRQNFGTGGAANVDSTSQNVSLTTSWTRYSVTFSVPSVAGKTIGASSYLALYLYTSSPTGSQTIDLWGVQLESGSTATAFRRNANSLQGELAACQRYYVRKYVNASGTLGGSTPNVPIVAVPFGVPMRTAPTAAWISGGTATDGTTDINISSMNSYRGGSTDGIEVLYVSASNFSAQARGISVRSALTEFNAEL